MVPFVSYSKGVILNIICSPTRPHHKVKQCIDPKMYVRTTILAVIQFIYVTILKRYSTQLVTINIQESNHNM